MQQCLSWYCSQGMRVFLGRERMSDNDEAMKIEEGLVTLLARTCR